jgi:hypothetical protein
MDEYDACTEQKLDSLDGLVEKLRDFTTLPTVIGVPQSPSPTFEHFQRRRSTIEEEGEDEQDQCMSITGTAEMISLYSPDTAEDKADVYSMMGGTVLDRSENRDVDSNGWGERDIEDAFSVHMSLTLGD